jgi:hypothetical protein
MENVMALKKTLNIYLDKLYFEFFIDGYFRDGKLIAPKEIIK